MSNVRVVDYDPSWAEEFSLLKDAFENILNEYCVSIEHVGSTSIYGLAAKPIIDIDIVVDDENKLNGIIEKLEAVGYKHRGDLGIKGRQAFKRLSEKAPIYNNNTYKFEHNLYVCQNDIIALKNHLLFRDYLRSNKEALDEYADLKRGLANKYPNDIDSYCEAKTDFITSVLKKAGLREDDVNGIAVQNTLD